jgi:hypothetical protein
MENTPSFIQDEMSEYYFEMLRAYGLKVLENIEIFGHNIIEYFANPQEYPFPYPTNKLNFIRSILNMLIKVEKDNPDGASLITCSGFKERIRQVGKLIDTQYKKLLEKHCHFCGSEEHPWISEYPDEIVIPNAKVNLTDFAELYTSIMPRFDNKDFGFMVTIFAYMFRYTVKDISTLSTSALYNGIEECNKIIAEWKEFAHANSAGIYCHPYGGPEGIHNAKRIQRVLTVIRHLSKCEHTTKLFIPSVGKACVSYLKEKKNRVKSKLLLALRMILRNKIIRRIKKLYEYNHNQLMKRLEIPEFVMTYDEIIHSRSSIDFVKLPEESLWDIDIDSIDYFLLCTILLKRNVLFNYKNRKYVIKPDIFVVKITGRKTPVQAVVISESSVPKAPATKKNAIVSDDIFAVDDSVVSEKAPAVSKKPLKLSKFEEKDEDIFGDKKQFEKLSSSPVHYQTHIGRVVSVDRISNTLKFCMKKDYERDGPACRLYLANIPRSHGLPEQIETGFKKFGGSQHGLFVELVGKLGIDELTGVPMVDVQSILKNDGSKFAKKKRSKKQVDNFEESYFEFTKGSPVQDGESPENFDFIDEEEPEIIKDRKERIISPSNCLVVPDYGLFDGEPEEPECPVFVERRNISELDDMYSLNVVVKKKEVVAAPVKKGRRGAKLLDDYLADAAAAAAAAAKAEAAAAAAKELKMSEDSAFTVVSKRGKGRK